MNKILEELLATGVTPVENGDPVPIHSSLDHLGLAMIQEVVESLRPRVTLEIGLAYGVSALAICEALERVGGERHIAIDPNQHSGPWGDAWKGGGLLNLKRAGFADLLSFYEEPSHLALPQLERQGQRVQFALIDGWATFDYRLVDFVLLDRLLDVGGVVMTSVPQLPSIQKLCRFIVTNLAYSVYGASGSAHDPETSIRLSGRQRGLDVPEAIRRHFMPELREPSEELGLDFERSLIAFRKDAEDSRRWDHFEEF